MHSGHSTLSFVTAWQQSHDLVAGCPSQSCPREGAARPHRDQPPLPHLLDGRSVDLAERLPFLGSELGSTNEALATASEKDGQYEVVHATSTGIRSDGPSVVGHGLDFDEGVFANIPTRRRMGRHGNLHPRAHSLIEVVRNLTDFQVTPERHRHTFTGE